MFHDHFPLSLQWTVHKNANHRSRDEAKRLARKIPMEILAKEWLNMEGATVETRAFLVDKVSVTFRCHLLLEFLQIMSK